MLIFSIGSFDIYAKIWFFRALLLKVVIFGSLAWFFHTAEPPNSIIAGVFVESKDYPNYYIPVENLVDEGTYYMPDATLGKLYANRMPGILPVYAPLYLLFGYDAARFLMVLIQLLMDVLAVVLVARTAYLLVGRREAFIGAFWLYAVTPYVSLYSHYGLTEAFAAAAMGIGTYCFVVATRKNTVNWWLGAGTLMAWVVFLRPAMITIVPAFGLIALFVFRKQLLAGVWRATLLGLPLLLFISIWTARNYQATQTFIPAANTMEMFFAGKPELESMFTLVKAWGGDVQRWNPRTKSQWFAHRSTEYFNASWSEEDPLSSSQYTPDYNYDSLLLLRELYWKTYDKLSPEEHEAVTASAVAMFARITTSYKEHNPFNYYVWNRLRLIGRFMFVPRIDNLPYMGPSITHLFARLGHLALYYLVLLPGLLGILLTQFRSGTLIRLLPLLLLAHLVVHAAVFGMIENRYMVTMFPLLALYGGVALDRVISRVRG